MSPTTPEPKPEPDTRPLPPNAWRRRGEGLEFDRVIFFTDAVFAIALTLLVVSISPPVLRATQTDDPAALWNALGDMTPQFVSFFLAFILIGRYWMAHHSFIGQLRAVDQAFIALNLVYLAFVAFLPFPTALIGELETNPLSVIVFAICLAIISGMETVQLRYAYRHDLMRVQPSPKIYRYWVISSLSPVVVFIVTLPLAFVSTTLTLFSWLLTIPIGRVLDRTVPEHERHMLLGEQLKDGES